MPGGVTWGREGADMEPDERWGELDNLCIKRRPEVAFPDTGLAVYPISALEPKCYLPVEWLISKLSLLAPPFNI